MIFLALPILPGLAKLGGEREISIYFEKLSVS
jgi:hypothetical protein